MIARRLGATAALLVTGALLGINTLMPARIVDWMSPAIAMGFVVALLTGRGMLLARLRWPVVPVVLSLLLLMPTAVIVAAFGDFDVTGILIHLQFGVEGATLAGLETQVANAALNILLLFLVFAGLAALWPRAAQGFMPVAALGLVLANPIPRALIDLTFRGVPGSVLLDHLVAPSLVAPLPTPPDLVVIYLEGTERTFGAFPAYRDAYAPIDRLARRPGAVVFTGVDQV